MQRSTRARPSKSDPVEVQVMGDGFLDVLRVRDISSSGVGVHVSHGFQGCNIDSEVEVVLTLPGCRSFRVRGRIRHRTDYGGDCFFGIELLGLSRRHREWIQRYVRHRGGAARER